MKRTRFTEEQIVGLLRGTEARATMPDLAGRQSVPEVAIYKQNATFSGP